VTTPSPRAGQLRVGCGAGYSGDRIEPAVELARDGGLQYLVFECLAERTIALAQQERIADPGRGYDPRLAERLEAVLPLCHERGVRILTNMGAANPTAAAARAREVAGQLGLTGLRVAAVTGDDVLAVVADGVHRLEETGRPVSELGPRLVSANAYLGAAPLVEALRRDAELVICGRVADPALFLAAQVHHFGWSFQDWTHLGRGTLVGHLLECAGQVTGGYFADPETLPVAGLERLGFPLAEVDSDGVAVVTKVEGSGGAVTEATCKAQLLYEIHDPARYLTPDVTADLSQVRLRSEGPDRVRVTGGGGAPPPDQLKVSVGYRDGWIGEGQISYGGPGAVERARLALEIVRRRLATCGVTPEEFRGDLIGLDSLGLPGDAQAMPPREVRLRVAARAASEEGARRVGDEVESLYTNGPAGGGGATKARREVLAIGTTFVARDRVRWDVACEAAP